MTWLDNVLKNEYTAVSVLKKTEDKSIVVLRNKICGKEMVCRKYKGDAQVYKQLRGIVSQYLSEVYDVMEDNDTVTVLEEYVHGITVGDILQSGLYSEKGVRQVAKGICDSLSVLHSLGIVHRDIKPENVMITNNGTVKLIDFDTARIFKFGKPKDTVIIGTVGYAAPEQMGHAQSDQRTDIFSLGVLMNVMLTGEHPSKKMYKGKLAKIIEKATRLDPNKRYGSVAELKKFL